MGIGSRGHCKADAGGRRAPFWSRPSSSRGAGGLHCVIPARVARSSGGVAHPPAAAREAPAGPRAPPPPSARTRARGARGARMGLARSPGASRGPRRPPREGRRAACAGAEGSVGPSRRRHLGALCARDQDDRGCGRGGSGLGKRPCAGADAHPGTPPLVDRLGGSRNIFRSPAAQSLQARYRSHLRCGYLRPGLIRPCSGRCAELWTSGGSRRLPTGA
jgi:hypothetical protein